MKKAIAIAVLLSLAASPAWARPVQVTSDSLKDVIRSLVRDLGAARYDVRERASQSLRQLGAPAMEALSEAAMSDDPEVSTRAKEILIDLRLGIGPDWPADMVLQVRHYPELQEHEKYNVMRRLAASLKERAVPFLISRLAEGQGNEPHYASSTLSSLSSEEACRQIVELLKDPKSPQEKQVLSRAMSRLAAVGAAPAKEAADGEAKDPAGPAIAGIIELLRAKKTLEALQQARKAAEQFDKDARPVYLEAEATAVLRRGEEAKQLRAKALAMNDKAEAPHLAAGEMLLSLGRRRQAAEEFQAVLKMSPEGGPGDINALWRLGATYAASGLFSQAAEFYGKASSLLTEAKAADPSVTVTGGDENTIRLQSQQATRMAQSYPLPSDTPLEDDYDDSQLRVRVSASVMEGAVEDLRKSLQTSQATVSVEIQPEGLRLLELPGFGVAYDPAKKELALTLNGSAMSGPIPLELRGPQAVLAIASGDGLYFYQVETEKRLAQPIGRFRIRYNLTVEAGDEIAGFSNVVVRVNGQRQDWVKLQSGLSLDRLPKTLKIVLEGTRPDGRRVTVNAEAPMTRPPLDDVTGPTTTPASAPATRPAE